MKFSNFLKKSFYLLIIFTILLTIFSVMNWFSDEIWEAWFGLGIAFVNFVIGVAIISWGFEKPDKIFYSAFFGGMLVRFVLIFLILFILIKYFNFDRLILVGSLLVAYFAFLGLEIWNIWKFSILRGKKG